MTVKLIIEKYLDDNGFDGLYCPYDPCGCYRDDLFPCANYGNLDCVPGYKCTLDPVEWGEGQSGIGPKIDTNKSTVAPDMGTI